MILLDTQGSATYRWRTIGSFQYENGLPAFVHLYGSNFTRNGIGKGIVKGIDLHGGRGHCGHFLVMGQKVATVVHLFALGLGGMGRILLLDGWQARRQLNQKPRIVFALQSVWVSTIVKRWEYPQGKRANLTAFEPTSKA
jgi:hypothetical protein